MQKCAKNPTIVNPPVM